MGSTCSKAEESCSDDADDAENHWGLLEVAAHFEDQLEEIVEDEKRKDACDGYWGVELAGVDDE